MNGINPLHFLFLIFFALIFNVGIVKNGEVSLVSKNNYI